MTPYKLGWKRHFQTLDRPAVSVYLKNISPTPYAIDPPLGWTFAAMDRDPEWDPTHQTVHYAFHTWTVRRRMQADGDECHMESQAGNPTETTITYYLEKNFVVFVPKNSAGAILTLETPAGTSVVTPGQSSSDGYVSLVATVSQAGSNA